MRWVFVVLAVLVLAWTSPTYAQSIPSPPSAKPSAADDATAKRNFESGLRLYGEGSYAEALIAFEQSYRVGGRPSALKNIAQCHRNLKHFVEAYEAYEQMLALHEAQLPAPDKTAVRQALDELGVLTGTIELTVNESGADIEIDGKGVGRSPMSKPKRVKVDPHTVKVSKAGFQTFEQSVVVGSQEQKKVTVNLEAEKNVGRVSVREQSGREVHVFVDGQDKGSAPWDGDIPKGEHAIELRGPRFASESRKITVATRERLDIALDATPLTGHLRVTTIPATATISIDGKAVGAGAWESDLPEGTHRVEVSLGSEPTQVRDVMLSRGQFLVQEIPVVSAIASGRITDYNGYYVKLSALGFIGLAGNADNSKSSPTYRVEGNSGTVLGAAGVLRIGRAWDWYAAEVVGMFFFEHRDRSYDGRSSDPNAGTTVVNFRDESNQPNGFLGAGGRVTSKDDTFRFTFGAAPGLMIRSFGLSRHQDGGNGGSSPPAPNNPTGSGNRFTPSNGTTNTTNQSSGCTGCFQESDYGNAGYTTLGLLLDAGVLFGSTPGAKFFLGVNALLDFAPSLVVGPDTKSPLPDQAFASPGRGVLLTNGVNFYVGPTLGVQFGH